MADSFGMLPGNNAPMPVFGGTNPTGMLPGGFSNKESFGFPNFPMFGAPPSNGIVTPTANLPLFGGAMTANTGNSGGGGIQGLNSSLDPGLSGDPANKTLGDFIRAYGSGPGTALYDMIFGKGLFNPQVANAFLNAMQPAYNRGIASVEQAFGAEGARFGSSAALGIGDFASQFNLNEQQTLAQMFMNAQQQELSLLENMMPTLHQEVVDSHKSGFWSDLLGGLEIAGGIIGAPFTGGMSLGLVGSGINTLAGGLDHSGSSQGQGAGIPNIGLPGLNIPGMGNDPMGGSNNIGGLKDWFNWFLGKSGASALTGDTNQDTPLMPLFGDALPA